MPTDVSERPGLGSDGGTNVPRHVCALTPLAKPKEPLMELGLVGLGKMGGNMRERIRRAGHTVIGYDRNPDVADVHSLGELVGSLKGPRVVWIMVQAGVATQTTVDELAELLSPGDIVVDGGNSRWPDYGKQT